MASRNRPTRAEALARGTGAGGREVLAVALIVRIYTWWKREEAQGMVEYGLILALIAVVVIAVLTTMGTQVRDFFQYISTKLGTPPPP